MSVRRLFNRCLLRPRDIEPSREDFEVVGVFNPGVVELAGEVVLMVRVAERPRERREGFVGLPRWAAGKRPVVDWVPEQMVERLDPRAVRLRGEGGLRLTFLSHLRIFRSPDGRSLEPLEAGRFEPQGEYERYGVEDPRIVRLGDRFWVTYVAVSEHGAATALASTGDFRRFERHGVVFCPENKDVVLLPERVGGEFVALHRPNPRMHFSAPGMWLARSPDLIHWGRHVALHAGVSAWEAGRVGAGPPPVRVQGRWLVIYHGMSPPRREGEVGTYCAGALLLDGEEPARVVGRTPEPVLAPEAEFEREGFVPGVVFPSGVVQREGRLLVYYGAADTCVGLVELALDELVAALC